MQYWYFQYCEYYNTGNTSIVNITILVIPVSRPAVITISLTFPKPIELKYYWNKMKSKKYHTVGTIPKSNIKIVKRGKIDTPNTQIHDWSIFWLGTGTSIKRGGDILVLWAKISPLSEMMLSCKCFPHVSKIQILTTRRTVLL